jgi:hypothetical protein
MSPRASRPRGAPSPTATHDAEAAVIAANGHLLRHYSTSVMGGTPRRHPPPEDHLWEVPIVFTSPGYGAVGEVGVVTVDHLTGHVVGGTPKEEVGAAVQRLCEDKRDALEAAFRRARTI